LLIFLLFPTGTPDPVPQVIGKLPNGVGGVQSQLSFHGALIFLHLGHSHAKKEVVGHVHIFGGTVLFQV
jgi:hypothetical protein